MSTEVTEQNRIDDMNEVIAIFDGWELREGDKTYLCERHDMKMTGVLCTCYKKADIFVKNDYGRYHYELKYHEDWNQLMGVVEKIESLGYKFQICRKRVTIIEDTGVQLHVLTVKESKKIATVHKAVHDFIQWYQSVKK